MADQNQDKQLDDLLESMLSTYSDVEPRPGLTTRILATLKEHSARRQLRWVFSFAASTAIVLLILLVLNMRSAKQDTTAQNDPQKPPEALSGAVKRGVPALTAANTRFVGQRRQVVANSVTNKAILQMAEVSRENASIDNSISEPETLSLAPAPRQETEPAIAQLMSTPNMSIRDLGVRVIEIKELNPTKDLD